MIRMNKMAVATSLSLRHGRDDAGFYGTLGVVVACLAVLATLLLPGCSSSSSAHAVDAPQARDALKIALDAWKSGENMQGLAVAATPMVVQDLDWAAGAKLKDYEIVGDGQPEDANLRIQVKLTTEGGQPPQKAAQAKAGEKKVWYLVTTSPKITIFRDMLRR
jgi:hypothetical protein